LAPFGGIPLTQVLRELRLQWWDYGDGTFRRYPFGSGVSRAAPAAVRLWGWHLSTLSLWLRSLFNYLILHTYINWLLSTLSVDWTIIMPTHHKSPYVTILLTVTTGN